MLCASLRLSLAFEHSINDFWDCEDHREGDTICRLNLKIKKKKYKRVDQKYPLFLKERMRYYLNLNVIVPDL